MLFEVQEECVMCVHGDDFHIPACLYICDLVSAPKPTVRFIKFGIGVILFDYKTVKSRCFSGSFSNTFCCLTSITLNCSMIQDNGNDMEGMPK